MKTFERLLPTEDEDVKEIVAGILHAQMRSAVAQHRPLMRGTHTKGICVRGSFEVFDLDATIEDPILRERLKRGMFAKPGVYPAVVRFANADTTVAPDFAPDVRAVSFAVELPAGLLPSGCTRHDFTLNAATTFPINDAHSFAILTRILEAGGVWGKLMALTTLSPSELWGLVLVGIRGAPQKRNSVRPYQRFRFWSNTPFRHGPDEAVKYSATASSTNLAHNPPRSENMLQDELVRHLDLDQRMAEFSFAIQFLDSDRMRHHFRKRDDFFWVENASAEWPEDQAPFHTVGRITLTHGSKLTDEECRACYIDVTEHSTPESHPLGSINRARWFAESASRNARLGTSTEGAAVDPTALPSSRTGAPVPAAASQRGTWVGNITVRSLTKAAAILVLVLAGASAALAIGATLYVQSGRGTLPEEHVARVDYPDRGFGAGVDAPDRQRFYYTPQGAGLKDIRYKWFVNLEMPWGTKRIADPTLMRRYGFLVDGVTERNPDQLPVGFTKHFDQSLNEELLDITCATCHTGQINVTRNGQTRALRIDGGQANHAFTDAKPGDFLPTMIASLLATTTNPLKFNRFAHRVLGPGYDGGKWTLYRELWAVNSTFAGIAWNENLWPHRLFPTREGFGRTDALARIGNTVFAENLDPDNYKVGNGPVNFPSLWNIWKFDWVQYNASVSQPMARNIGEAMGVGAKYALVDPYGNPLPASQRFRSTALIDSLNVIEQTLHKLKPPAWDEEILGPVNQARADTGKVLFNKYCAGCHGPHVAPPALAFRNSPGKRDSSAEWIVATLCANDVGTDPNAATNFYTNTVDIRRTGMTAIELRRVAQRTAARWVPRESTYIASEIARLKPFTNPDSVRQRESLVRKQAGLWDAAAQDQAQIDPSRLPLGAALSYLGTMIREKAYADAHYDSTRQAELDGFGALDMPQVIPAYKSRPLAGVWATPPFLHNGSVPTIYALISDVALRPDTFRVGSREYDTAHLGLAKAGDGFQLFNTKDSGNHNTGHEFGAGYNPNAHDKQVRVGLIGPRLTEAEKMAILEHLKVRDDDRDAPPYRTPPSCTP